MRPNMRMRGRLRTRRRAGSIGRIPLSGWRGEVHPALRDPTPAERARVCPYCGQVSGIRATKWCPSFDELILRAALEPTDR